MATRRGINSLVQHSAAKVASLPAPIGGWNVRDSIANMDVLDAVQLTNLFPSVNNVVLRPGYTKHATGLPGQVQTLMGYSSGTTNKLFAVVGTAIYDVTTSGAVGAPVVTALSNAKWEYVNVTTPAGNYLYAVNGSDAPLLYNGSTWTNPAITGVTPQSLNNITTFKNQVWFTQNDTLKAWYLPTLSIAGAAAYIDMSAVAQLGGELVSVGTWTIDAGYGVDDNLVFITSNGEVIVYSGTDPSDITKWALVGVWRVGKPVGKRCLIKYGGDIVILTFNGVYPLAASLQSSRLDPRVALSDKIQGAFQSATQAYGETFGWQMIFDPKHNALSVNVPVAAGQQQQYVMNNITKSWCNFTGWAANCWEIFNNEPYFGANGYVAHAWDESYADDGANISSNAFQAFNYFETRGVKKYFTRARPSLFTNGAPSVFVGMNVDFDLQDTTASLAFSPSNFGLWDTALWDDSYWGTENIISNNWQGITGIGYCGSTQFKSASQGVTILWASTDIVYQTGWAGI
jgi:hypothetical protein